MEDQIKRYLDIPDDVQVEAVFPIGFAYEKKKTKRTKIDLDNILFFNAYGQTQMKEPRKINV